MRFVELQRKLDVGRESLHRAIDALVDLGYVRRNPGYGHPLRPEYVLAPAGRRPAELAGRVLAAGDPAILLRKWSVPCSPNSAKSGASPSCAARSRSPRGRSHSHSRTSKRPG